MRSVERIFPQCREELGGGPEKIFDEAARRYFIDERQIKQGGGTWQDITSGLSRQRQMIKAVLFQWAGAANNGHAGAQYNPGAVHEIGRCVKQNYKEAVRWYNKPADQGQTDAQFNLGIIYFEGQSTWQDYKEAVRWSV